MPNLPHDSVDKRSCCAQLFSRQEGKKLELDQQNIVFVCEIIAGTEYACLV